MEIPLQITFRNLKPSPRIESWLQEEVAKLELFYPRIMSCHVTVEMPHHHHKNGSHYQVRIDITVPGGEIYVGREPNTNKRLRDTRIGRLEKQMEVGVPHKILRMAIDDAFRSAGRKLQDYARRQGGQTKLHEPMLPAIVDRLFMDDGYGFLKTEDDRDIYFHKNSVLNGGFSKLKKGMVVRFVEEQGEKGAQATSVHLAEKRHKHIAA